MKSVGIVDDNDIGRWWQRGGVRQNDSARPKGGGRLEDRWLTIDIGWLRTGREKPRILPTLAETIQ